MPFAITRGVLAFVPVVLHKVDSLAAGVVFATVPAPVPLMARTHMQVNRWAAGGHALDHAWTSVDNLWRRGVAEFDTPIKARLTKAD